MAKKKAVSIEQALAAIDAQAHEWEDLVAEIGPERAEEKGPHGDWTFKDLAAHIAGWENRELDLLEDPEAKPPWKPGLDIDGINAFIYERNADRPLGDVLRDAWLAYGRLREIAGGLSEDDLNDPKRFSNLDGKSLGEALVSGSYFSHIRDEHGKDISAWQKLPEPES
jgi:hypothetical protein